MSFLAELRRRNVIRVLIAYLALAWFLIQLADTVFPAYGLPESAVGILITMLAIGLIPVTIASWAFEWTPEGLKRDADVAGGAIVPGTGKTLDRVIMIVLALAVGFFAFDKFVLDPVRDAGREATVAQQARADELIGSFGEMSIAVLPFVNISGDEENEYFSDGISEELLNLLAKVPKLRVISRSSSFTFKGREIDIPTIAAELNVAHVLEGSVRKSGDKVRITAQLIDARADTHLWSETYDRNLVDIFQVQDEISAAIVHALEPVLGITAAPRTAYVTNPEAYEAYLRGRSLVVKRGSSITRSIIEFEKAVALDPNYPIAHAELAMAYLLNRGDGGWGTLTESEAVSKSSPHIVQALALDSNLAEAHAAAGLMRQQLGDNEGALIHLNRATNINHNFAQAYSWMAIANNDLGNYGKTIELDRKSLQLDPLSINIRSNYIDSLLNMGKLKEADKLIESYAQTRPVTYQIKRAQRESIGGNWSAMANPGLELLAKNSIGTRSRYAMMYTFSALGLPRETLALSDQIPADIFIRLGMHEESVAAAEARLAKSPESASANVELVNSLAAAGEFERAIPLLENAWKSSSGRLDGAFPASSAIILISMQKLGIDKEIARAVIVVMRDDIERARDAGFKQTMMWFSLDYREGIIDYFDGHESRGMALIRSAIDDGYFSPMTDGYLQTLYDDPDFAPIRQQQDQIQERERAKILNIVCTNNPYAPGWQPESETCKEFASKRKH